MIIKRTLTKLAAVGATTALAMALTAAPAQAEIQPTMHPRYCAPGHVLVYVDLLGIRVCVRGG